MHPSVLQYADLPKNQDIQLKASEVKVQFPVQRGDRLGFSLT